MRPQIDSAELPQQAPDYDLRHLLELGCHFGHKTPKWHPLMDEWIYDQHNGVHIFDLAKTAEQLQKAYNFAYKLGKENKTLIFVGTKRQARDVVKEAATEAGAMYINQRWLGGFLTNWSQVKKSLRKMLNIEKGLEEGQYDTYTKYERTQLEKEANRFARFFEGVRDLKGKPDALFVIDPKRERVAVDEAVLEEVPVIGLIDSNTDPRGVNLPIPANDDAVKCVEFIVRQIAEGYAEGKKNRGKVPASQRVESKEKQAAQKADKKAEKRAKAEAKKQKDAAKEKAAKEAEAKAEKEKAAAAKADQKKKAAKKAKSKKSDKKTGKSDSRRKKSK
jgi:small subunit ribosomal protein S2